MDEQDKQSDQKDSEPKPQGSGMDDMRARLQEKLKGLESVMREKFKDMDETVRAEFRDAVPSHVSVHLQKSKEEFLLAVRGIIDRQIEKAKKQQQPTSETSNQSPPPPPNQSPPPED